MGFIPGRYIDENTRLIYDILHFTEEQDIPGILLLIDFEKAFDSISWIFIEIVLDFFLTSVSPLNNGLQLFIPILRPQILKTVVS